VVDALEQEKTIIKAGQVAERILPSLSWSSTSWATCRSVSPAALGSPSGSAKIYERTSVIVTQISLQGPTLDMTEPARTRRVHPALSNIQSSCIWIHQGNHQFSRSGM
jgi:hypothetical protein